MRVRCCGWLVVFLALAWAVPGWANPVDLGLAEDVAGAFIEAGLAGSEIYRAAMGIPADVRVHAYRTLTDGTTSDALAYVFELKPTGYIVVTVDTELVPIVAYSYTSSFSWEESPQNILLGMLRLDMANRLRALEDGAIAAEVIEDNERSWDELRGLRPPDRWTYEAGVYGPWTTDPSWHQSSPYWDDCPIDPITTTRSVVGCVATALAQILNYWQTPTSVTFLSGDSYTTDTRGIWINAPGANFTGFNYNDCNPTNAAKADLSYAAGVSVRMDYTSAGSSAYTFQAARALAGTTVPNFVYPGGPPYIPIPQANQRWGYHSADLRTYNNPSWGSPWAVTQTTFYNDLKSNMMQAQPAILAIRCSSPSAGHAILVDGYHPTDDDYHLNYGWGGTNDGWYSLPSVLPGPPSQPYDYDVIDQAVYNVVPTTSTYTLTTTTSGTGTGTVQALPGTGALTRGTHVLLSATASPGSTFDNWSGDLSGSANPALLILDGNKTVNAVFSGGGGPISSKKWTVMVYLAADNNLGGGGASDPDFLDMDEIETALVSSGSAVNVIVLWDMPGQNDSYIYWVQPHATEGQLASYTLGVNKWVPPWGSEVNMGAQSNLTYFLDWVSTRFTSDYHGLVLWNHGGGWEPKSDDPPSKDEERVPEPGGPPDRGICWDDTDGYDYLTTKEMVNGISGSCLGSVDNLGLDACLMQMLSVAYEARVVASYLTASEETEWGAGWAYHQILSTITTSTTPLQLAQLWGVTRSSRHYAGGLDTISSLDLSQVGALATAVSSLANRLTTLLGTPARYYEILETKLIEAFSFSYPEYVDLDDLCVGLKDVVDDATVRTRADAVRSQLGNTVVAEAHGSGYSDVGGLAIYFPHGHEIYYEGITHGDYNGTNFAFCADHTWDDFLNAWLATDYADPFESNNTPASAHDLGTYLGYWEGVFPEADFDDDVGGGTVDWYKFTANHTFNLDVKALCTEAASDTVLYAYDSLADAIADSYFASNDDGGYGYGSWISAVGRPPGTYYLKVRAWGTPGADEDYVLYMDVVQPTPATFRVESGGNVCADGTLYSTALGTGSADVAEWVNVSEAVEPGDVLELDPENPGAYRKARGPCSPYVAGVVSTDPGVVLGESTVGEKALLALVGIVPVKACDEGGPIEPGDLLATASRSGYVRRCEPSECGFIVGKAIGRLVSGEGLILVLLTR